MTSIRTSAFGSAGHPTCPPRSRWGGLSAFDSKGLNEWGTVEVGMHKASPSNYVGCGAIGGIHYATNEPTFCSKSGECIHPGEKDKGVDAVMWAVLGYQFKDGIGIRFTSTVGLRKGNRLAVARSKNRASMSPKNLRTNPLIILMVTTWETI